jgi:uncharacterized protein YidB (DUF937 family)
MGFLDGLAGELSKKLGGADVNGVLEQAMGMINNPATGGLPGLIDAFKNKGLGEVVSSWIATGRNLPVSADQIIQVLGQERIAQIAQKVGMSQEEFAQQLSVYLPQLIDKLSPNGQVPSGTVLQDGLSMLAKSFLK